MKCDKQITNRIKRIQGQMNGVLKMMENEADCEAMITQLKAIKSAIEKSIGLIAANNLVQTIERENDITVNAKDAIDLIVKGM